jgi:hypothetical protein
MSRNVRSSSRPSCPFATQCCFPMPIQRSSTTHLLHAPTLEQGKAFEMQIAECTQVSGFTGAVVVLFSQRKKKKKKNVTTSQKVLSPQTSATDVQHYCTCQDEQCSRRCVAKRASVIRVAVRWFRYFERVENARGALTDADFHHKSLVDHVLVTLLVEKGAERRIDSAEAALDANAPPRSAATPDPFATASNEW